MAEPLQTASMEEEEQEDDELDEEAEESTTVQDEGIVDEESANQEKPEQETVKKKKGSKKDDSGENQVKESPAEAKKRISNTIVLQPGTENLRVGRATDESPTVVPHCIARLLVEDAEDPADFSLPPASSDKNWLQEKQREMLEVERSLKRWSGPTRKTPTGEGDKVDEEIISAPGEEPEILGASLGSAAFYCGSSALRVTCQRRSDGTRYSLHRPFRRGRLFAKPSLEVAACDLQAIWEHAIRDVLSIPLQELANMACVLIVPANICKMDIKIMADVLLTRMQFGSLAVVQDASCSSYQAHSHTSCVVDIGAGKTSVTVVEDGSCVPCASFHLGYGGLDMERMLLALLKESSPASDKPPSSEGKKSILSKFDANEPYHCEELRMFKERTCYILGAQQDIFWKNDEMRLALPNQPSTLHRLRILSPACLPPMGLFHPKLFEPLDWKLAKRKRWADAEEIVDDDFVLDMLQNRSGGQGDKEDRLLLRDEYLFLPSGSPLCLSDVIRDAIARVMQMHEMSKQGKENKDGEAKETKLAEFTQKLYGNIILAGGCSGIKGLAEAIEQRLSKIKPAFVNQATVLVNPKSRSSLHLAWCGGKLVASAECYREIFVKRKEWQDRGIQVLRERVCFPW